MCWRCTELTRRSLLVGGGAAAAALHTGTALARVRPQEMVPLVGPGYKPTERDELGLWKEMDRVEEEVAGSNLLITDPKITGYLRDLIGTDDPGQRPHTGVDEPIRVKPPGREILAGRL